MIPENTNMILLKVHVLNTFPTIVSFSLVYKYSREKQFLLVILFKEKKNDRFDQGLYRFLDPKFKTFSKLFSKTIISFSRLKRDLKNMQEQSVFMMLCKCTGWDWITFDKKEKNSFIKHLLQHWKEKKHKTFHHFSGLYLHFPNLFQVWKTAGHISRFLQEFKTLYEPWWTTRFIGAPAIRQKLPCFEVWC